MGFKTSNKVRLEGGISSMTDLVFLLLIFFIMVASMVNESHEITLPEGSGDPSEHSPVKVYLTKENKFLLNSGTEEYLPTNIELEIEKSLKGNNSLELLADKEASREFAYQVIKYAKTKQLKVIIKTKGG
jgi:biopolymer transport protein ExbD